MDTIVIKALAAQSAVLFIIATGFAAEQPHRAGSIQLSAPLASPTPTAYYGRARQLIVGTATGEVRRIAGTQTRKPRDAGRLMSSESSVLRLRVDAQRERLWVLNIGSVHVFDLARNQLIRSIALPNWFHTDDGSNCLPDLQLDQHGAAFVSDNVQPKLWRIDGNDFAVLERIVTLDSQRGIDAGFSALTIGEGGVMFGAMAAPGSLWRIDSVSFRAENIALSAPIHGACGLEALNAVDSGGHTLFVLRAGGTRFDVGRIDLKRGARVAQVDNSAFGSVPEPASLLAWSGTVYVASNDAITPVFRRLRGSRVLSASSVVHRTD
jgi:hypothetical protein